MTTFDPIPLLRQVELTTVPRVEKYCRGNVTDIQIAGILNVSVRQVWRWRHGQQMTMQSAERCAEKAGFLPCEIWADWYERQLAELGKVCASCGQRFFPLRSSQKFCTATCRRRENQRRYRATPNGQERARLYSRAYYVECAEYKRAWRRAFYAANADREKARQREYDRRKRAA